MRLPKSFWILTTTGAVAATVAVAATSLLVQPGCTDDCSAKLVCPPTSVFFGSPDHSTIPIVDLGLSGPACPPQYGIFCAGDTPGQPGCTHFTVTGLAPGACDVGVAFGDNRPAEIIHLQFAPNTVGKCCPGYPVIGDSTYFVPSNPDAQIMGMSGSTDAVEIITDAGASTDDAGASAGDAGDAGAPSDAAAD